MVLVSAIEDLAAISFRFEELGFGKLVKFFANRVCGYIKLLGQFTKI